MKVLLAPSETKRSGGTEHFDSTLLLFSEELSDARNELLQIYATILQKGDIEILSKMFGLKKESDILYHQKDIFTSPTMKVIERYTGVAFDYLDYTSLDEKAQEYVDTHVILFSNLFGPIRANDKIPEYRLKQGERVGDIQVEKFYREHTAELMEAYLKEEEVLDLRAGFYDKFYKPQKSYTTPKFIKGGKVVSHWAKAYRGIVLREIAKKGIETLDDFLKLPIDGLSILEIQTRKNKRELIYEITK